MSLEPERRGPQSASTVRRLSELAGQAVRCAPSCCGAATTFTDGGPGRRSAATHPDLAELVAVQLTADAGPVLSALALGGPAGSPDLLTDERWPAYRASALASGVRSSVTLPQRRAGIEVTVSLFSFRPRTLEDVVHGPVGILLEQVTASLVRDRHYRAVLTEVDQLAAALRTRPVIDQATGMVMHILGCDAQDAFGMLRRLSQSSNRKLAEVAEGVVRGRGRGLERDLARMADSS
ncbi:ANTAR domain-containing response regulator [Streptomyces sp. A5-4]|uniref:ANTAR domain-containing response regulator n=1 Tax=Streptomyces sp. A5-4 TaxID=3384771 RepID=UPI003DA7EBF9